MTRIVIDKENEITKLKNMLENLTDEKDKQSVRFAINVISGFNEVLSERPQGEWIETGYETGALGITYRQTQCSNCGWEHALPMWWNYCPNCGADMRGGAE